MVIAVETMCRYANRALFFLELASVASRLQLTNFAIHVLCIAEGVCSFYVPVSFGKPVLYAGWEILAQRAQHRIRCVYCPRKLLIHCHRVGARTGCDLRRGFLTNSSSVFGTTRLRIKPSTWGLACTNVLLFSGRSPC